MGLPGGPNHPIERAGVNAARALFEAAGFIFQEVPKDNDIGKDAYVDLSVGGVFTGDLIALQIKSGRSYRRGENYKVTCDEKHRALWRGSSIPIYGLVYDPSEATLRWANLTDWARALDDDEAPSFCSIPRTNVLDEQTLDSWVVTVRRQLRARVFPSVLDLVVADGPRQAVAAFDSFALGRSDPRPLKLLRASLRWLADVDATWPAIQILSLMTSHPDIAWTDATWLPERIRHEVRETFRWSAEEAEILLAAPAGDMWSRGDLGQCAYMLLLADPRHAALLEHVAMTATDEAVVWQAALILVALAAERGLATLNRLVSARPMLEESSMYADLHQTLREHGAVSLF